MRLSWLMCSHEIRKLSQSTMKLFQKMISRTSEENRNCHIQQEQITRSLVFLYGIFAGAL